MRAYPGGWKANTLLEHIRHGPDPSFELGLITYDNGNLPGSRGRSYCCDIEYYQASDWLHFLE